MQRASLALSKPGPESLLPILAGSARLLFRGCVFRVLAPSPDELREFCASPSSEFVARSRPATKRGRTLHVAAAGAENVPKDPDRNACPRPRREGGAARGFSLLARCTAHTRQLCRGRHQARSGRHGATHHVRSTVPPGGLRQHEDKHNLQGGKSGSLVRSPIRASWAPRAGRQRGGGARLCKSTAARSARDAVGQGVSRRGRSAATRAHQLQRSSKGRAAVRHAAGVRRAWLLLRRRLAAQLPSPRHRHHRPNYTLPRAAAPVRFLRCPATSGREQAFHEF